MKLPLPSTWKHVRARERERGSEREYAFCVSAALALEARSRPFSHPNHALQAAPHRPRPCPSRSPSSLGSPAVTATSPAGPAGPASVSFFFVPRSTALGHPILLFPSLMGRAEKLESYSYSCFSTINFLAECLRMPPSPNFKSVFPRLDLSCPRAGWCRWEK